jgi:hypothetical protein
MKTEKDEREEIRRLPQQLAQQCCEDGVTALLYVLRWERKPMSKELATWGWERREKEDPKQKETFRRIHHFYKRGFPVIANTSLPRRLCVN